MNHFVSQFAGELGLISVGLGKEFERYSISGLYGIVPSELAGGPFIETVALKQIYTFHDWKKLDFYGGLNVYHVLGGQYEASRFGDQPEGYYSLSSIRGILYLGFFYQLDNNRERFFYSEAGVNDLGIQSLVVNRGSVNPTDYVSLALGYKVSF